MYVNNRYYFIRNLNVVKFTTSESGIKRVYQSASSLIAALRLLCKFSAYCSIAATASASSPSSGELLRICCMADCT